MYYLEDAHPRYEYTIYVCQPNATPYIGVWTTTDIKLVYREVREIEKRHGRYNQPFYIDNDFYENEYKKGVGTYYKFMKRQVNDWQELSDKKENVIIYANFL